MLGTIEGFLVCYFAVVSCYFTFLLVLFMFAQILRFKKEEMIEC